MNRAKKGVTGICTIVFIIFLIQKLAGLISWSWWWVTLPLWMPLVAVLTVVAVIGFLVSILIVVEYLLKQKPEENE